MTQSQTNDTNLKKDFNDLEKEALKEISLEIIKSDLQNSLSQLHQKNMAEVGNKISIIKEDCAKEIREGIKKHIQEQLEEHFQKVVQSCQTDISQAIAPLLRRAEQDLDSLNTTVSQTNMLCDVIQKKYSFRWEKPFLLLFGATIATGALIGVILFLFQTSPVAVFLMNEKTRRIYDSGLYWMEIKKRMLTDETLKAQKSSHSAKAGQKPSKPQKKKKSS